MSELSNKERVLKIAMALEELNAKVVYVGGSVVQFYASDQGAANPMTTYDVDCVVDLTTYREYHAFEEELHGKNFSNDTSEGAPICRYLFDDEIVDFMPKVDTGIGESNRWYPMGVEHKQHYLINSNTAIFIMPVSYYLASKFEALNSRGGNDYRGSKDFEDIVYVVNSCHDLKEEIENADDGEVRDYLRSEFSALCQRPNIQEEIGCAIDDEGRVNYVLDIMKCL